MKHFITWLLVGLSLCLWWGCEKEKPTSLFDPDYTSEPRPVITSVEPENEALAAVMPITIHGEHFPGIPENIAVWFNTVKAEVVGVSNDQVSVISPNLVADSVMIKIAVRNADRISEPFPYRLLQSVFRVGNFNKYDTPNALTVDLAGNVYVYNSPSIVIKVTPDGTRNEFGSGASVFRSSSAKSMKIGPDDYLYMARNGREIARIGADGGNAERWVRTPGNIYDFDFTPDQHVYGGGIGDELYLITPEGNTSVAFDYPDTYIRAVRYFDGYLYIAGENQTTQNEKIWRHQILDDHELGNQEEIFDWSTNFDPFSDILCMTFSADGKLYIGTDDTPAIVVLSPDGSFEPLYPGVLVPSTFSMCWGPASFLYITRQNDDPDVQTVLKINMLEQGAPYYGRK